jgi:plasmid maintenance system antidote protein VapI
MISATRCGEILRGDRRPTSEEARVLAQALGADPETLFELPQNPHPAGKP